MVSPLWSLLQHYFHPYHFDTFVCTFITFIGSDRFISASLQFAKFFALFSRFQRRAFGETDLCNNSARQFTFNGLLGYISRQPALVLDDKSDVVRIPSQGGNFCFQKNKPRGDESVPDNPLREGTNFFFQKLERWIRPHVQKIPAP